MFGRLLALIKKEFLAIKNDKKSLVVVIVPPLMQLIIFSFAATLEVKNIVLVVFDQDGSRASRELIRVFEGSRYVRSLEAVQSYQDGAERIDNQEAIAFAVIPRGFGREPGNATLQLILDGRRSNTAQIVEEYLTLMAAQFAGREGVSNPMDIVARNLYNPNLNNFWWIVPNLFGSITMIVAMILTSLAIARERELGTFDQIMVSPLRPVEILLGKLLPALLISVAESTVILSAAVYLFGIPLTGSLAILYLGVFTFLFSMAGIGLLISMISATQQQAILGTFVVLLPFILLSGFATPVENMPAWLQPISEFIPLKYYLVLIKGVLLKDIDLPSALYAVLPMVAMGIVSFSGALLFFKKKTG